MKIKILSITMIVAFIGAFTSCSKKGCTDPEAENYNQNAKKDDPDNPCVYLCPREVQNKNVILEEFGGIDCGACPSGHKEAADLHAAHPNDVFVINVQVGQYSVPDASGDLDFRTEFGDNLKNQTGLNGYPAGTVNRHVFSGLSQTSGTAMSRSNWEEAVNTTLAEASYVNVAAKSSINLATRVLTVDVEAYFTGAGASNNKINVALLQNNCESNQSGSSQNPSQQTNNGLYKQMHMLRHLITGQWGEDMSTTTAGSMFSKTYTYTIPASLDYDSNDSYDGAAYVLSDLEVVVFVTEGQQEVISGAKSTLWTF